MSRGHHTGKVSEGEEVSAQRLLCQIDLPDHAADHPETLPGTRCTLINIRQYNSSHAPSSRHSASSSTTTIIRCQRSPQAMVINTTDSKTSTTDQIQSSTLCQQLEQPTFNDLPMSPVLPVDLSVIILFFPHSSLSTINHKIFFLMEL